MGWDGMGRDGSALFYFSRQRPGPAIRQVFAPSEIISSSCLIVVIIDDKLEVRFPPPSPEKYQTSYGSTNMRFVGRKIHLWCTV